MLVCSIIGHAYAAISGNRLDGCDDARIRDAGLGLETSSGLVPREHPCSESSNPGRLRRSPRGRFRGFACRIARGSSHRAQGACAASARGMRLAIPAPDGLAGGCAAGGAGELRNDPAHRRTARASAHPWHARRTRGQLAARQPLARGAAAPVRERWRHARSAARRARPVRPAAPCAAELLEAQADALLAARTAGVDAAAAPFLMAALQVIGWTSRPDSRPPTSPNWARTASARCGSFRSRASSARTRVPGLSLPALRPLCDGMAHGPRDLQPVRVDEGLVVPVDRRRFEAVRAECCDSAGPTARSSTRRRTGASSRGGRPREPRARPAPHRRGFTAAATTPCSGSPEGKIGRVDSSPAPTPHASTTDLPSVDRLLNLPALQPLLARHGRALATSALRSHLEVLRRAALAGQLAHSAATDAAIVSALEATLATGIAAEPAPGLQPHRHGAAHQPRPRAAGREAVRAVTRAMRGAGQPGVRPRAGERGDRDDTRRGPAARADRRRGGHRRQQQRRRRAAGAQRAGRGGARWWSRAAS